MAHHKFSRYKVTPIYEDEHGSGEVYGIFTPPDFLVTPKKDWRVHIVRKVDIGMLDQLAVMYFGRGYEQMYWCIALANNIIDVESDMYVGQKLYIPPTSLVEQYVGR